jgi:hypothetical protein
LFLSLSSSFVFSLSMLSSPSGSSDSDDISKRDGERKEDDGERARQQQQQQQREQPITSSSDAHTAPRPPSAALALSDAEAAAAGAALKRARATARARRKGSLLASSSAPRAHIAVPQPGAAASSQANPPRRILDPSGAASDADAAARLRAWLCSTLARPGAARSGAYARHRAAVVRKALSLLETKRSEAQDAELQALLGGLSL